MKLISQIINQFAKKPKNLFLADSLGALLTTFFLFAVLRNFHEYFGMPPIILTYLSITALVFCIYSTACFLFLKANRAPFIRAISIANLLYCVVTIGLLLMYSPVLTIMGWSYFLVETVIVCGLAYIELKVATFVKKQGM